MKILVAGANGQVGYELQKTLPSLGEVIAVDRSRMDLAKPEQVRQVIREVRPNIIVNAAAYTAVDQAESERDLAMAINAHAPGEMAKEAKHLGATLIHYSTDYVFDGTKQGRYVEDDVTGPLGVYGESKLLGEQAIAEQGIPSLIFRTQWVYGTRGKNFMLTMLRLAQERDELRVVNDQFGAPTWSRTLAEVTAGVISQSASKGPGWWEERAGVYHVAAQGETTWCGFAEKIVQLSALSKKPQVSGIPTTAYPTPAKRPANSRINCDKFQNLFLTLPQWDQALTEALAEWSARPQ